MQAIQTPDDAGPAGPADAPDALRETAARRAWMSALARAPADRLRALRAALEAEIGGAPEFAWLRPPESGAVMVRGRAGGTGAPFNLGEMTATRCALRLATGEVGHAWVSGRDRLKAEAAALCDALLQRPETRDAVEAVVLRPLAVERAAREGARAARAATTKVEFFTMVRGESE